MAPRRRLRFQSVPTILPLIKTTSKVTSKRAHFYQDYTFVTFPTHDVVESSRGVQFLSSAPAETRGGKLAFNHS